MYSILKAAIRRLEGLPSDARRSSLICAVLVFLLSLLLGLTGIEILTMGDDEVFPIIREYQVLEG